MKMKRKQGNTKNHGNNISLINNPNLIDMHPSWKEIFEKHETRKKNDYSKLSEFAKKYLTIKINATDTMINWLRDKDEISDSQRKVFSKKMYSVRTFFQKNEANLNSFCLAFGYVYIEKMLTEGYHFKSLLDLLKSFNDNHNLQFVSPQSLKTSINEQDLLNIEELPHYMHNILMMTAEKLLFVFNENKDRYCEIMTKYLLDLFNEDIIFLLCVILFIRTKALNLCKTKKKYKKHCNKFMDFTSDISQKSMEIIAKALKCEIIIFNNEEKTQFMHDCQDSEKFNPFTITLFKSDMYHAFYPKKEAKSLLPKNYQLNSELKEKLCSFCFRNEGRKYEKCKHTYCHACLSEIIEKSKKNIIKCPECSQCLGNKENLGTSRIY